MSTIITKNSSTASAVPVAGDLVKGELAVNVTDKKVYTKDNSAAVVKLVGSLGNQEANTVAITGGTIAGITDLAVADGGTGASTAVNARTNLGAAASGANSDITSLSGLTTALSVAQGGTGVTTSTGTGNVVLSNSPTLVTPALGTPSSVTLTNATGLPVSTGISGLATNVATFLGSPTSANLRSTVTDETGSGSLVFATSPYLVTPDLGVPSAAILTNATGLPLSTGVTGTLAVANGGTGTTTSTGTGSVVLSTSPTLVTPALGTPSSVTLTNATGLPVATGISGLGTGVATALAVNVGSAGAPVVNGSALGTPSSGTVTNLTGTASININGTVGATTATTGAFTDLTTSGSVTHNGGTASGVAYLNGSKVLTTGPALVFDGKNLLVGSTTSIYNQVNRTAFEVNGTATSIMALNAGGVGQAYWYYDGAGVDFYALNGSLRFGASGSEQMRLTSTGLGIGTSSPVAKLGVAGNAIFSGATPYISLAYNQSGATPNYWELSTGGVATLYNIGTGTNGQWRFVGGAGSEFMRLDASGNLLVGTTTTSSLASSGRGLIEVNGSSDSAFVMKAGNTLYGYLYNSASEFRVANVTANPVTFFTNNTERARIDASGNLLVGTTDASATSGVGTKLIPNGQYYGVMSGSTNADTTFQLYSTGAGAYRFYVGLGGTVYATSTTISAISDQRLKENVQDLDVGLDKIMALKPRKFDWKAGKGKDIKGDRGWIAQEFEQVFPDMIDTWKDEAPEGEEPYKSVRAELIPVLVKAMQEQQAIIATLTARVAALESSTLQ